MEEAAATAEAVHEASIAETDEEQSSADDDGPETMKATTESSSSSASSPPIEAAHFPADSTNNDDETAAVDSQLHYWQTTVRNTIYPLLPPPVTKVIREYLDPTLEHYVVGPEPTITVMTTILLAYIVYWLGSRLVGFATHKGGGRAIQDDHEDEILNPLLSSADGNNDNKYDATVVLVGPKSAGKTRLFYHLCYNELNVPTLMSLKPNVGISSSNSGDINVRYVDWPGHAPLTDPTILSVLLQQVSKKKSDVRVVFVLDASQPVTEAADVLFSLLQIAAKQNTNNSNLRWTSIFVACHKKDLAKAKNHKRIKIQLRTELERLLTVKKAAADTDDETLWWPAGEPLELNELKFVKLHFCSTTCCEEDRGMSELLDFCRTGTLPGQ